MRLLRHIILVGVAIAAATPAGAQERSWEREIERAAEDIAEAVVGQVARVLDDVGLSQRNRQQRERDRSRADDRTETFSQTVRLGRDGTLDLSNVAGDIVITGGGGDDVRITAIKRVRHGSEAEAQRLLQELQIRVTERGANIEVRTEMPRRRGWQGSVDFEVSVPQRAHVSLRSVSGDIRVTNVRGEVRAESVSGDVTATDVARVRQVKSVSGDVQVTDAQGDEFLGGTVSGDAVVRNLKARSVDFGSVSGDVRFSDVEAARASLRTVSGNIDFSGRLSPSGRYEMKSHSGNIRLTPGEDTGFDLEANTFSGNVRSDFPLSLTSMGGGSRGRSSGPIRGTFGNAGAVLTLQSFSGNIVIARR